MCSEVMLVGIPVLFANGNALLLIALQAAKFASTHDTFIFRPSLTVASGCFSLASLLQMTHLSWAPVLPKFTLSFVCLLGGRGGTVGEGGRWLFVLNLGIPGGGA